MGSAALAQTEQAERCNKVLQCLAQHDGSSREALMLVSGLDSEQLVLALFELRQRKCLYVDVQKDPNEYHLTGLGKKSVPPKFVKDISLWKGSTEDKGSKHVVGLLGKFDYSKPLKGAKLILYEALTRPMTANQVFKEANMQQNHGWTHLVGLQKLGIIASREEKDPADGKTRNVYYRVKVMKTETEPNEPPKPVLTPATPGDPVIDRITQQASISISNFSKPNPTIEEAILELRSRYSVFEILLASLACFEPEYKELIDFRQKVQHQLGDLFK